MRIDVSDELRSLESPPLDQQVVTPWGRALAGQYPDAPMAGKWVIVLQDRTDPFRLVNVWMVYETSAQMDVDLARIRSGPGDNTAGAPVPSNPYPPIRPGALAIELD